VTEPPVPPPEEDDGEFPAFFHTDDLPASGSRPRGHRAPPVETPEFLARLLAPATAVIVVIVVIVLLIWINGGSSGHQQSPAAVGGSGPAVPIATRSSTATSTPTSRQASPSDAEVTPSTLGPTKPAGRAHSGGSKSGATAPVTVLNNSTRSGLAAAAAAQLRDKGWKVPTVGNLQGRTPYTTVYYAPGEHAVAKRLAHDFASIQRGLPNHAGGVTGSGLTLVLTRTWQL